MMEMATEARYGWELPDLADVADGPDAFLQFANDVSDTISNTTVQTYTPSWTSLTSGGNPFGVATRSGHYRMLNKVVDFVARLTFGSGTSGGLGELMVGLPVPANSSTQYVVNCILWTPSSGGTWLGYGAIDQQSGFTNMRPQFPINNARSDMSGWASTGGILGLSIPTVPSNPGGYSVMNGGYFTAHGRYFAA
jgi:hypothetical protein